MRCFHGAKVFDLTIAIGSRFTLPLPAGTKADMALSRTINIGLVPKPFLECPSGLYGSVEASVPFPPCLVHSAIPVVFDVRVCTVRGHAMDSAANILCHADIIAFFRGKVEAK